MFLPSSRSGFILLIAFLISFVSVGCSQSSTGADKATTSQSTPTTTPTDSKATQCGRIVEITNNAQSVTSTAKARRPESILQATAQLDQLAKKLEAVQVSDEKLVSLKSRYQKMYQAVSQATKDTFSAVKNRNRNGVGKSLQSLQEALNQDKDLVKEFNSYCSGSS